MPMKRYLLLSNRRRTQIKIEVEEFEMPHCTCEKCEDKHNHWALWLDYGESVG